MDKFNLFLAGIVTLGILPLSSCRTATPPPPPPVLAEETALNVVKITDESKAPVYGLSFTSSPSRFSSSVQGGNKRNGVYWNSKKKLAISPDGEELAYLTAHDGNSFNVMTRRAGTGGTATQRTTRQVNDISWGKDDKLYFPDITGNQSKICVIDSHKGSLMRQLTSGNIDMEPALSPSGNKVFFTRMENSGPMVWSFDLKNGELISCARGFCPTPVSDDEFVCVRNTETGNSEIWSVNFVNGQENLILSDEDRGYTHPTISPDGEWMLVVGNSISNINKTKNLDIFAVKMDGSNMIQLTYHPGDDTCPQWSNDGRTIFFLSNRANTQKKYNIWRMNFLPD